MKRAVLSLAVVLAACGTPTEADPSTTSAPATPSTTTTSETTTTSTTAAGAGLLVIAAIDFEAGNYTLRNDGDGPLDLTGYFACNRPSYAELPAEILGPGEQIDISGDGLSLSADDGELGVYNSQSFGSTAAIRAYVQWGSDGHGRTGTAVDAGVWTAGEFVDNGGANLVSAGSEPITAADWSG